jgi:diguanylate cyclase (GGDEF)-like protein/PAS domain S-box-containing protein
MTDKPPTGQARPPPTEAPAQLHLPSATIRQPEHAMAEELRTYQAELEMQNLMLSETNNALVNLHAHYEILFTRLPLAALVINEQGQIQEANTKAKSLLHLRDLAHNHPSVYRFLAEHDDVSLSSSLAHTAHSGQSSLTDVRLKTLHQAAHPFQAHIYPLHNELRDERQYVVLLVDRTTETALAHEQAKVAQSEARFRMAQQASGFGVWHWHIPQNLIVWDAHCGEMLGFPAQDTVLTFEDWCARIHPDDLPAAQATVQKQLQEGEPFVIAMRYCTADGGWLWTEGRGQVTEWDDAGQPTRMAGTHINIQPQRTAQARADELLNRFNKISAHVPGLLYQFQAFPDGRIAFPFATAGMQKIYGFAPEAVREDASPVLSRVDPQDLDEVVATIEASQSQLTPWYCQYRVNLPGKPTQWLEGEAGPEALHDGSVLWHGYIHDITAQKRLQDEVQEERQRLSNIIWGTGVGTWEWNVQTGETRFNERWAGMLGHTLAELAPISIQTWMQLIHPDDLTASAQALDRHFKGETDDYDCEIRMRHKDGHWVWVQDRGRIITRTAEGLPEWMAGTHLDITARKTAELKLSQMAHHDSLTGLPRRSLLADRLQLAMSQTRRRQNRIAVAFIDLDGFKCINDVHGHAAGDFLLVQLARRMQSLLRAGDTVARVGGDEFVMILADLHETDESLPQIQRLLAALSSPVDHQGVALQVSASIGVVFYPSDPDMTHEELLKRADQAMYMAKQRGKNGYCIA